MGCFHVQKPRKLKVEEHNELAEPHESDLSSLPSPPLPVLSAVPSFRRTAKAIQNAQRFIAQSKPKLLSSHPSYGGQDQGSDSKPVPLPSPLLSPKPTGYALPHPSEHPRNTEMSPNRKPGSVAGHGPLNSRVFPWDLQRLPPPRDGMAIPRGLKSFSYEDLQFAHQTSIGDDGISFVGTVKSGVKGLKQQEVVIVRRHESLYQGLKEWMSELSTITCLHNSHLCKLVGFYAEDKMTGERLLVYEKLYKGSLHDLLFEASESPPLDWPTRMKIVVGAAQGLASLHEKCPNQILYKDFRLSHIQVDNDYNSKLSGYGFVSGNIQSMPTQVSNSSSKAQESAYCAPEVRNGGTITLKGNVWSFGVVLLEILCGRKNKDKRMSKDEKHDLVKWAKPFLLEEDKLFLIMDPKLQGRFPAKGAKIIANLILQCLQKDPTRRPTMKVALEMLKATQEMRNMTTLSKWKGRTNEEATSLGLSQSVKPVIVDRTVSSYNRSPTKFDLIHIPQLKPLIIPLRSCDD